MGCHSLLQGISLTQGLNPGLLHCRQVLYHLSHRGWEGQVQMQPTELRGLSGMRVSLSSISQEGWWSRQSTGSGDGSSGCGNHLARMGTDCRCHRGSVKGFVETVLPALVFLGYSPSFQPSIHPSIHPSNPTFTDHLLHARPCSGI